MCDIEPVECTGSTWRQGKRRVLGLPHAWLVMFVGFIFIPVSLALGHAILPSVRPNKHSLAYVSVRVEGFLQCLDAHPQWDSMYGRQCNIILSLRDIITNQLVPSSKDHVFSIANEKKRYEYSNIHEWRLFARASFLYQMSVWTCRKLEPNVSAN